MTTETLTLAQTMRRFTLSRRRRVLALGLVRAAWVALALVPALIYVDVLIQLGDSPRAVLSWAYLATVLLVLGLTYYRQTRAASEARMVARLVEQEDADFHNDIINALDFEDVLEKGAPTAVSRSLMQTEVAVAAEKASRLKHIHTLTPASLRRELHVLGVAAPAVLAIGAVLFDVFAAVVPRYLDPYGDHPPYSATRLSLEPAGVTVDYGEDVHIRARAEGVQPEEVMLVLAHHDGSVVSELPMLRSSEGDYVYALEHVKEDYRYYARIHRGRSKRYELAISKTPRISTVGVTFDYPEYTRLPSKTRQLGEPPDIMAYAGTRVALHLGSNRPLKAGTLRLNGAELPMTPEPDAQTVTGPFELEAPGELEARLIDVDGRTSADVFRARVLVQPDEKPRIAITTPSRQSFAIPTAEIPITIESQDDLGVANMTLYRSFNGSGDFEKNVFTGAGGDLSANAVEVLNLADLGVRPGDVIDYYATVTDTYPAAPQTAATPSHKITIVSEEDYRAFLQKETSARELSEKYTALQRQLESLAVEQDAIEQATQAIKNAIENGGELSPEDSLKLSELAERQELLAERAFNAAQQLENEAAAPPVFDIEKDFKKTLEQTAQRLRRAHEAMERSRVNLSEAAGDNETSKLESLAAAEQNQRDAKNELGQSSGELADKVQKPVEDLEKMANLLQDIETFKAIYNAQTDLERQARSYREVRDPSLDQQVRLKELGQVQREIRSALIDLRNAIDQHAAEIEPDLPEVGRDARDIVDGIDGRNIPTIMEQAMNGLSTGNGARGHESAEEARALLDQMIERAQQGHGSSQEFNARLRITMGIDAGATLDQMKSGMTPGFMPGMSGSGGGGNESSVPFDMFGPDGASSKPSKESAMARSRTDAEAQPLDEASRFAGSFEEIATPQSTDAAIDAGDTESIAEEYRAIIKAYFERIAEEKP